MPCGIGARALRTANLEAPSQAAAQTACDRGKGSGLSESRGERLHPLKEGTTPPPEGRPCFAVDHNTGVFLLKNVSLKNVSHFQSGANICFLVISANSCLRHKVALGLSKGSFTQFQHSKGLRHVTRRHFLWGGCSPSVLKGPRLCDVYTCVSS